jgi:chromosome partitioning protein
MESGKIIVVANQKGGVAKTSTVRNLSYALAEMGKKVLVVDFDPQYNLTTSFGVLPTQAPYNTGTLITNLLLDESLPDQRVHPENRLCGLDPFQPISHRCGGKSADDTGQQ